MKNRYFEKRSGIVLLALLIAVMMFAAGCKSVKEGDDKPEGKVTQQPAATEAVTATPTPSPTPTPTPSPTPTPIPTVQDVFETTDDEGVYFKADVVKNVYTCDAYAVGDRIIFIKEIMPEEDESAENEDLEDNPDLTGDETESETGDDEEYDEEYGDYDAMPGYDALYICSYDPLTGDMIEKKIEGWDFLNWTIETYSNGTFSLGGDMREELILFDNKLNEIKNMPVAVHYNYTISRDTDKVWVIYNDELNCYEEALEDFEEADFLGKLSPSYFLDDQPWNDISGVCAYKINSDYDYEYQNVYFNTKTGEYLGTIDSEVRYIYSPDLTKAIRIQTQSPNKIEVYECSSGNLFPGEQETDPETGDLLPPAHEAICRLAIGNTSETDHLLIDWERGYVLTDVMYSNSDTYIYENNCYSLQTGELVSNFTKNGYESYPYYTFDPDRGLFYTLFDKDGNISLYAWDYSSDTVRDYRDAFGKFSDIPEYIDQKRHEMEEKYGFYFYIGPEIAAGSFGYDLTVFTDYKIVNERLDKIDEVLSIYPEGFFEQFKYGGIKTLSIYLCGTINRKPGVENTIDDAIALANVNKYERALALDLNWDYCLKRTIVHELSHWIDGRIESFGELGGYDTYEEEWLEQNPEDYSYKYSYTSGRTIWKYIYSYDGKNENTYFIDSYSQTYPTEDRARLFEYLMYWDDSENDMTDYLQLPHLQDKLDFYFKVIRKCFDTTNWPEKTIWEEKLAEKIAARETEAVE